MLNKKGFTIAEVLVSFSLISIILASIISSTLFYRDRLKQEEVITALNDFKNSVMKNVYDDIIYNRVKRVENCIGIKNCVNFIDSNNKSYPLNIEESNDGVYLHYGNMDYFLPDSDLKNEFKKEDGTQVIERVCDFIGGLEIESYNDNLYKVKISFLHKDINLQYDLLFVVS